MLIVVIHAEILLDEHESEVAKIDTAAAHIAGTDVVPVAIALLLMLLP